MTMKRNGFQTGAVHHIYQRFKDKGVLFYDLQDRLVYYTLAATASKKFQTTVSAASLMFTHIHQCCEAGSKKALTEYLRTTDSSFARLYNFRYRRGGHLFDRPVGHSCKLTAKEKRSALIYVFNNHVEKGLCREAIEERWSFIAYAFSSHPFSEEINKKKASGALLKALRLIDRRISKNKALEYADIDRILPKLNEMETEQFVDYVISHYAWIDFPRTVSRFQSLDALIVALNSTTGSEYGIKEDFTREKDTGYVSLLEYARRKGILNRIFTMSGSEKLEFIINARHETQARDSQLKRLLHYDFRQH